MTRIPPSSPLLATVDVDRRAQRLRDVLMAREHREALRRLYETPAVGRSLPEVDNHFRAQMFNTDHVTQKHTDIDRTKVMYDSLRSMDLANNRFVRTERFLNIG
ncbi:hypothetical protein FRC11_014847, partial [Ceratobasidium sp. 423]